MTLPRFDSRRDRRPGREQHYAPDGGVSDPALHSTVLLNDFFSRLRGAVEDFLDLGGREVGAFTEGGETAGGEASGDFGGDGRRHVVVGEMRFDAEGFVEGGGVCDFCADSARGSIRIAQIWVAPALPIATKLLVRLLTQLPL